MCASPPKARYRQHIKPSSSAPILSPYLSWSSGVCHSVWFPIFPRLSLWCSEIVVSDVAHYNSCDDRRSLRSLLTSSAGKISSQREWFDLVPSRKAYFRQYPYEEERKSTKKHTRSPHWVQVTGCPMRRDSPLKAEAEKVDQNSKKNSTFDQIYKVDEHYKSDDLSVRRFLWIQTATQAFKEKNEKVSLTSPFLTPAARCGECRFNCHYQQIVRPVATVFVA